MNKTLAMWFRTLRELPLLLGSVALLVVVCSAHPVLAADDTFSPEEIVAKGKGVFGTNRKGVGEGIEKVFKEKGRPNGYITGEEASGAVGVGVRYGKGQLYTKEHGVHKVYWRGPSVGF